MYCSHLSVLQELLENKKIELLDSYFSELIGSAKENITVTKVADQLNITTNLATKVLTVCKEAGILSVSYAIRCPECHMLIQKVDSFAEIPEDGFECYCCEEEIEITSEDIELLYSINDDSVFINGQQKNEDTSARAVVQENSMKSVFLASSINGYIFSPTDDEYDELLRMYNSISDTSGTTKKIGDSLEGLTQYLFGLCQIFRASGIRTQTNQIDCCVRNTLDLDFGILKIIGSKFFIECKNESDTPSGGYMSKLHSIISITDAGGKGNGVKFGIIISKKKGPRTFKQLAVKQYLADGIVIISICGEELKELIENKGNLIELIERKANEIILDSTSDLVEAGLYDS